MLRILPAIILAAGGVNAACATLASTGSVYRGKADGCPIHIGVRPASDAVGDYAVTVQVTTDPWCRR